MQPKLEGNTLLFSQASEMAKPGKRKGSLETKRKAGLGIRSVKTALRTSEGFLKASVAMCMKLDVCYSYYTYQSH